MNSQLSQTTASTDSADKAHRSPVKSKLHIPTAAQIHGQWVPKEKGEPEKQWDWTVAKEILKDVEDLDEVQVDRKYKNVHSKLFEPTVASIRNRAPPREENEPIIPIIRKSTDKLLDGLSPVTNKYSNTTSKFMMPTAASKQGRYVKFVPPPDPDADLPVWDKNTKDLTLDQKLANIHSGYDDVKSQVVRFINSPSEPSLRSKTPEASTTINKRDIQNKTPTRPTSAPSNTPQTKTPTRTNSATSSVRNTPVSTIKKSSSKSPLPQRSNSEAIATTATPTTTTTTVSSTKVNGLKSSSTDSTQNTTTATNTTPTSTATSNSGMVSAKDFLKKRLNRQPEAVVTTKPQSSPRKSVSLIDSTSSPGSSTSPKVRSPVSALPHGSPTKLFERPSDLLSTSYDNDLSGIPNTVSNGNEIKSTTISSTTDIKNSNNVTKQDSASINTSLIEISTDPISKSPSTSEPINTVFKTTESTINTTKIEPTTASTLPIKSAISTDSNNVANVHSPVNATNVTPVSAPTTTTPAAVTKALETSTKTTPLVETITPPTTIFTKLEPDISLNTERDSFLTAYTSTGMYSGPSADSSNIQSALDITNNSNKNKEITTNTTSIPPDLNTTKPIINTVIIDQISYANDLNTDYDDSVYGLDSPVPQSHTTTTAYYQNHNNNNNNNNNQPYTYTSNDDVIEDDDEDISIVDEHILPVKMKSNHNSTKNIQPYFDDGFA